MIFYFSATGNTKWMAERAATAFGDTAIDIMKCKNPESYSFGPNDEIGIFFPVYACVAPPLVKDFASKLKANGAYTYAVCGYSNYTGHAMQDLSKTFHLSSGFGLLMPDDTSVFGYTYDNEDSTHEKLKTATSRMDEIINKIKNHPKDVFESYEGPHPEEDTENLPPLFFGTLAATGPFYVNKDKCIHCGLCAKNCPAKILTMCDGLPTWNNSTCYLCSACINHCPVEAIEYGDKSQGVYRYTFKKYQSWLSE